MVLTRAMQARQAKPPVATLDVDAAAPEVGTPFFF